MTDTAPLPLTAVVLAGGRSTRMGFDKTLAELDGQTLVERVVSTLADACDEVIVVTNHPDDIAQAGLPEEVRIVADELPYAGPLGALATAMATSGREWLLLVAADMPWIDPAVPRKLWEARDSAQAVVVRTPDGIEPLLALYARSVEPEARALLASGARRPADLLARIDTVEIDAERVREIDPELKSFANVNTPEELAEAGRRVTVRSPGENPQRRSGIPKERQTTIFANGIEVATVQATPDHLDELGAGFLVAEGLISSAAALSEIEVDSRRGLVFVTTSEEIAEGRPLRARYFTSGCGSGTTFASPDDAAGLAPVTSATSIMGDELVGLMAEMDDAAATHQATGGVHACALVRNGELALVREDIGRHNAFDKIIGRAWLDGTSTDGAILLTTGRITYEMAIKAAKARIPIIASRKAVSDLACEIAEALGITLVGYTRTGHVTVYTHPQRILEASGGARS